MTLQTQNSGEKRNIIGGGGKYSARLGDLKYRKHQGWLCNFDLKVECANKNTKQKNSQEMNLTLYCAFKTAAEETA